MASGRESKPKSTRRTPRHISGEWIEGDWKLADEQWLTVADAYCLRFKVAILASVAVNTAQAAQKVAEGLTEKAAAQSEADRARMAYERAVRDFIATGDPSLRPLAADMASETSIAAHWKAWIAATVNAYIARARIEESAPPIPATRTWMNRLAKAAVAFVEAYEAPLTHQSEI